MEQGRDQKKITRREFLSQVAMGGGLLAVFSSILGIGIRFLIPRSRSSRLVELFIGRAEAIPVNASKVFHDLQGREIIVLRTKDGFRGFSNICPHLGCLVHWMPQEGIFFCPCHLGKFDASGKATAGPPAEAGQRLFEVKVRHDQASGNLFLQVPTEA